LAAPKSGILQLAGSEFPGLQSVMLEVEFCEAVPPYDVMNAHRLLHRLLRSPQIQSDFARLRWGTAVHTAVNGETGVAGASLLAALCAVETSFRDNPTAGERRSRARSMGDAYTHFDLLAGDAEGTRTGLALRGTPHISDATCRALHELGETLPGTTRRGHFPHDAVDRVLELVEPWHRLVARTTPIESLVDSLTPTIAGCLVVLPLVSNWEPFLAGQPPKPLQSMEEAGDVQSWLQGVTAEWLKEHACARRRSGRTTAPEMLDDALVRFGLLGR